MGKVGLGSRLGVHSNRGGIGVPGWVYTAIRLGVPGWVYTASDRG